MGSDHAHATPPPAELSLDGVDPSLLPNSRSEVLEAIDAEIGECDKREKRMGTTTWVLVAALGYFIWALIDLAAVTNPRWGHVLLAVSVVIWPIQAFFALFAIWGVQDPKANSGINRFDDAKSRAAKQRAIFILDFVLVLLLALGGLLAIGHLPPTAWITAFALHGSAAVIIAVSRRMHAKKATKLHWGDFGVRRLRGVARVVALLIAAARLLATGYAIWFLVSDGFTAESAKLTVLLVAAQGVLLTIAFTSLDWSTREKLVDLRRDVSLGESSPAYAMSQLRELYLGTPLAIVWADIAFECNRLYNDTHLRVQELEQLLTALEDQHPEGPPSEKGAALLTEASWQRMVSLSQQIRTALDRAPAEIDGVQKQLGKIQQSGPDAAEFSQRLEQLKRSFGTTHDLHTALIAGANRWRDRAKPVAVSPPPKSGPS